ncbi:MAG: hypothetical protein WA159_02520 [Variovorax sp.]
MTNETERAGLLPCPFCGGEAEFKPYKKDGLTIKCKSFGCVRRDQRVLRQSIDWLREAMAKDWNTRTNPPPVDAAAERDAFTGEDKRELYSIGRAINRAATDLPEDWSIRIDLECGSGQVEIISPDGSRIDIDSGDLFSSQINEAIDAALTAQPKATRGTA